VNRWEDWAGTERSRPHLRSQERFKRALRGNTAAQIRSLWPEEIVDLASRLQAAAAAHAAHSDAELVTLVQSLPSGDPRRERACEALVARYQPIIG